MLDRECTENAENSPHRDLVSPDVLRLVRVESGQLGLDVTRGHGIGTCEPRPLHGEGLACSIIGR